MLGFLIEGSVILRLIHHMKSVQLDRCGLWPEGNDAIPGESQGAEGVALCEDSVGIFELCL